MTTPDQTCTCGHGAASAHDTDSSIPAFTACVVTGCGCKAFVQAPAPLGALAGREQRRRTTANILARIDRAKHIQEDEATLLRTLVAAEQADGDQAREQLAARSGTRAASDVLVQHDVTRKALCDALDVGYHLNWQQLVDTAQRSRDANVAWQADVAAARQGEAEAVRAREAAEAGRVAADNMIRATLAALGVGPDTDPMIRARETLARAEAAEATVRDYENRLTWETTCGEHARLLDSCRAADERASKAEATLTAVREAVADAREHTNPLAPVCPQCGRHHLSAIEAALNAPPVTVTVHLDNTEATFEPTTPRPFIAPCTGCQAATARCDAQGRFLCQRCDSIAQASGEPTPNPPPAPDGAELWASIRDHAARDHQFWDQLNRDWERQYRQGVRL